jgi:hypothetical protein
MNRITHTRANQMAKKKLTKTANLPYSTGSAMPTALRATATRLRGQTPYTTLLLISWLALGSASAAAIDANPFRDSSLTATDSDDGSNRGPPNLLLAPRFTDAFSRWTLSWDDPRMLAARDADCSFVFDVLQRHQQRMDAEFPDRQPLIYDPSQHGLGDRLKG